jgi:hypothetical protein
MGNKCFTFLKEWGIISSNGSAEISSQERKLFLYQAAFGCRI